MTALHIPFVNLRISREERQLERKFGEGFRTYKEQVQSLSNNRVRPVNRMTEI